VAKGERGREENGLNTNDGTTHKGIQVKQKGVKKEGGD